MSSMQVEHTPLSGVLVITPRCFADARGYFFESWQAERYREAGLPAAFVQDNLSRSVRGTLRGLHYQLGTPQGKLVSVVRGAVFDVAVDLRRGSPTFARWFGAVLSDENHAQLWIPVGFAHGFLALADVCDVMYKVDAPYAPADERGLRWNDSRVAIEWPAVEPKILSPRDAAAPLLESAEVFP
jgi:dTDP-4-dehydrorhamnose 3,5-epimerase